MTSRSYNKDTRWEPGDSLGNNFHNPGRDGKDRSKGVGVGLGMDLTGLGEGSREERRRRVQESHSHTQELYKVNSLEGGRP